MSVEVKLPKLGLTMDEGTVEEWLVEDGHLVSVGDPLLRLATDKVEVEVEAEAVGRFHRAVEAGATLPPGALIGWLLAEGEQPPVVAAEAGAPATTPGPEPAASAAVPVVTAAPLASRGDGGRLLASPLARRIAVELGVDITMIAGTGPLGRVIEADVRDAAVPPPPVSPLVRRDAASLGVDLTPVRGSGAGGRVTRDDVRNAASATSAPVAAPTAQVAPAAPAAPALQVAPAASTRPGVIPLTGMRGAIASRMVASLHDMAQLTHGFEVAMDAVVALRAELKRDWAPRGGVVPSLNDFVFLAAARALRTNSRLNATIAGNEIHLLPNIDVGLAVALPDGLVVPVVRDTDRLSLEQLAARTRELATAARAGRLGLADLEGATFVVTSLGTYGVDFFTPVINPGNVAILGVGRLRDGVRWLDDERPVRTRVLTLSLTFDHRAVDGAPAAQYLQAVADLLGRPLSLLSGG